MSWDRQCIYCNLDPRSTDVQKARRHTNLSSHMDNSHPDAEPIDGVVWGCPHCKTNRHFVREDTLREHIRRMHRGAFQPIITILNPLNTLADAADEERIRIEQERHEEERRLQQYERHAHDQERRARTIHQYRKHINKSPYSRRQDRKGLIPDIIDEESGDYEFKAKKSVKRSRKTKRSVKRSGKAKKSVKRSGKAKRSVKRSRTTKR